MATSQSIARSCVTREGQIKLAGGRSMQAHSSRTWETAVGGTRNHARAVFGSKDGGDTNVAMCHVVDDTTGIRDGRNYVPNPEKSHVEWDADTIIRRSISLGISIVEYCAMHGIPL